MHGVVYVGIDDTDIEDSPGTNQLARALLQRPGVRPARAVVLRHQLFFDPRVPYTSKNGSASLIITDTVAPSMDALVEDLRAGVRAWFVEGSDPGLAVARQVPAEITAFGVACQREVVDERAARDLAARHGMHLEGLGGDEQGVIGALAAVGLAAGGDDGRVVHLHEWPWPDGFAGPQTMDAVRSRGVDEVRRLATGEAVLSGRIDVGKHLRPAWRGARVVLLVEPAPPGSDAEWLAVKI